ncbi:prolyl oligopeptidase family serine peptidase [Tenuifilum thalassicum]|uniref:prolyl oligopeptidase n=1 Tax=Tenuifilum thalassicum TaxID=2590900 RepID=A0A7D3Y0T0_9BACT|nr:prolyl oligopeptidase family serine peptidase [Tenuifilum thalassicum]QKG80653.1 S9 family peptidase [Tenuifilum thalassicum]
MKKIYIFLLSTTPLLAMMSCKTANVDYPKTKKVDVVDEYFGVKVPDPYRWLEDDKSPEVAEWVKQQNEVTFKYLNAIPFRNKIKQRLTEIWNYTSMGTPFKAGGRYFFFKKEGLQNQSVLYMMEDLNSEPKVILDPNTFSEDGTVALSNVSVSRDGKYLAYAINDGGSDWQKIKVMELPSGKILPDEISWVKFSSIAWKKNGFYYSRYDEPKEGSELSNINKNHKVYYHKVGTPVESDKLIFSNSQYPLRNYSAQTTEDEKYLIIYESESTYGNSLYIKNLQDPKANFSKITTGFEYEYNVIDHIDDNLIVLTNYKAPKYKLIKINVNSMDIGNWRDILPERKDVLRGCAIVGNKILANYIVDAKSQAEVYDLNGNNVSDIELPSIGTISSISGELNDSIAFYSFSSFTVPPIIVKYNVNTNTSEEFFRPEINFNFDEYETKQVFYTSKDGTLVPMFIVHKKGIELDGNNPTLLYGYGGFNISLLPYFSTTRLFWLEQGGIFAVANIRGGGEYGENWYRAGTKLNKQNVFDDFIAAAEYLIKEKYTSPKKLAIQGGSNGGLLIGAVTNQRPDLFKVAIPQVGVMDMLRYHKFTIGWAWANDYGTSNDSIQFLNLYNYSPLHNIKPKTNYPAILVTTADHDDRVVPAHSFKYIATMQEKNPRPKNPALIRIQTRAGHGAGTPTSIQIDEYTDIYAFIMYNMDMKY